MRVQSSLPASSRRWCIYGFHLRPAAWLGDGKVTVKELDAYLQEQVPGLTQKYKGTPQYPSSYGFGQDFPMGVK